MPTETVASIDWRPGPVRWVLPVLAYGVAAWGACELTLLQPWAGWWLAVIAFWGLRDAHRLQRETHTLRQLRLHGRTVELDNAAGTLERAWLGPFGTAVWLRGDVAANGLLMIYPSEMSKAGYAALRRHLKLWVSQPRVAERLRYR